MDNLIDSTTTARLATSSGDVFVHKGRVLGLFMENESLKPWCSLSEQQQEDILLDLLLEATLNAS